MVRAGLLDPPRDTVAVLGPERFERLEADVLSLLETETFPSERIKSVRHVDARYHGQGYEIRIEVASGPVDSDWRRATESRFHEAHEREYAHAFHDSDIEIVNVGVRGIGLLPGLELPRLEPATIPPAAIGRREAWLSEDGPVVAEIYGRDDLRAGQRLFGPAVVEQLDSTIPVPAGMVAAVRADGSMLIEAAA